MGSSIDGVGFEDGKLTAAGMPSFVSSTTVVQNKYVHGLYILYVFSLVLFLDKSGTFRCLIDRRSLISLLSAHWFLD